MDLRASAIYRFGIAHAKRIRFHFRKSNGIISVQHIVGARLVGDNIRNETALKEDPLDKFQQRSQEVRRKLLRHALWRR